MSRRFRVTGGNSRRIVTRALAATGVFGVLVGVMMGLVAARPAVAATGIYKTINFQGKVVNSNGTNVTDGSYTFVFKLYSVSTAGTAIWTETKSLTVTDGIFQTNLGDVTSLPGSVDFNTDNLYLGINFNSDGEMNPRIRFTASPYAFNSDALDGLDSTQFARTDASNTFTGAAQTFTLGTSATAFAVQNASSNAILTVDTSGNQVVLGKASTVAGKLVFNNASNGNTTTLTVTAASTPRSISLPNEDGTICIQNSTACGFVTGSSASFIQNQNATDQTADFRISGTGRANTSLLTPLLDTATGVVLNIGTSGSPTTTQINLNQNVVVAGGKTLTVGGVTLIQPTATNTAAFAIKTPSSGTNANVFTVDTANSRVGIALGGSTNPTLAHEGLEIKGALRLSGSSTSFVDSFTTPVGSSVDTKINIPIYDPGGAGQVLAFGLPSGAATNSRAISVFDRRGWNGTSYVATPVQPAVGLFSPDENNILGFSWEGSTSTGYLKTTGGNIAVRSGSTDLITALSGGNVGIGLSPSYKLDVNGDANIASASAYKIGGTNICTSSGCTASATSAILNQNASAQSSANFWISGTGRADTALQAPLHSTADVTTGTSAALTVRSGNGTAGGAGTGDVTIKSGNANGAGNSGNVVVDAGTKGASGFAGNINVGDTNALNINIGRNATSNVALTLMGTASTSSLIFSNAANTFATTLSVASPTATRTVSFADASGTVCLDTGNCSGSNGYILNQSTSDQTASFRISGTGRANTSILTPLLDTASGVALNIGAASPTTTQINLNQNVVVASGKSVQVQGALTQSNGAVSLTGNAASQLVTSSGALTVTSAAAANWGTTAGDLGIYAGGNLNLGNQGGTGINIGTNAGAHTIAIGTDATAAQGVTLGSSNASSTVTARAGATTSALTNGGLTLGTATNSTTAFQVQNSAGANVARVDTTDTNLIQNPGAEATFGSEWTAYGTNTTVSRNTANSWNGAASVAAVVTPSTGTVGAKNALGAALATSQTYTLSFYAKLKTGDPAFTDISARYLRDGSTVDATCASFNTQTVVSTGWTRVTCTLTTSVTGGNASAAVAVYQAASAARTFYLDGVQLEQTNNVANAYGAGSLQLDTVLTSPLGLQNGEDSTTAFSVQNAGGTSQLVVDTVNSKVMLSAAGILQTNNVIPTAAMTIGASSQSLSLLGSSASSLAVTNGGNTLTVNFATPTVNGAVYQFAAPTTASTTYTICTTDQNSCGASASAGYLRKGVVETDNVNVGSGQLAVTITNSGSVNTGVLKLDNGAGQNSALVVTSAANAAAGNALIFASNTLNNATGNLLDLQSTQSSTLASRFAVDMTGNLTQAGGSSTTDTINGQRISSAANFTGTVTAATGLTVSAGGAAITGNSTMTGTLGVTSAISATGTGAAELIVSGAPAAAGNTSLVQVGNAIASGSTNGTYLGLNLPNGSTADMLNYQLNGISKFKLDNNANITATGTYNTNTFSSNALQFGNATTASIQPAASQALTITAHGTSTWSTDAGNLTLDAVGTANLGTGTATGVNIGKSTTTTTQNGTLQVGASAGTGAVVNNGTTKNATLAISNLDYSGSGNTGTIGGAGTTVDLYTAFTINETTTGQTLTVPTPSVGAAASTGRVIYISNIGSAAFTLLSGGATLNAGSTATLVFNGSAWTFAGADGSSILNQNTSDQSANFRINGTGRANTSFTAPLFDSISGGLNVGTGTATSINLGGTATTGNLTLLTNSASAGVVVKSNTNSTTALTVQNAIGANVLRVDTTDTNLIQNPGGEVAISNSDWPSAGYGTGVTVSRVTSTFWNGAASVSVATTGTASTGAKNNLGAALAISQTYTLSFYAKLNSGSFTDIAAAYSRDGTAGTEVACANYNTQTIVTAGWTRVTCTIATSGTTGNTSAYIAIRQTAGASRTFFLDGVQLEQTNNIPTVYGAGSLALNAVVTSPLGLRNTEDSTTAFSVQTASGSGIFNIDTLNGAVRIGDNTNFVNFAAGTREPSLTGNARHSKNLILTAEFAGAVLDADGSSNTGTMTAAFEPTQRFGYYKWVTTQGTAQDYDIVATVPVPDDFNAWTGTPTFWTYGSAGSAMTVTITDTAGTTATNYTGSTLTVSTTWTARNVTTPAITGTYTQGSNMIIRIHMTAAATTGDVRLGTITLPYLSRW